jgi:phosphate/phosphite/phosphonate ABC transporter binding protein
LCAQEIFRIGVIPFKTDTELNESFKAIAAWIKQSTGYTVQITYVEKDELAYLLSHGHLDMGVFRPLAYLQSKNEFPELQISLTHQVNGKDSYTGYILVKKDSEINSLQQLQGKRFTFIKPSSTSGYLIPRGMLRERGIIAEDFFADVDFSYDHKRSIEMLLNAETDGIAVSDEDMEVEIENLKSFKTIASFKVPNAAYVYSPGLDILKKEKITAALLDVKRNPAAKALINNPLHISGWTIAHDELYNPLRRYMGIDRIKPSVQVVFNLSGRAKEVFAQRGDMHAILKRRVLNELRSSGRFYTVDEIPGDQKQLLNIEISQLEDGYFNYHLDWNNEPVGDADIDEGSMLSVLPGMIKFSILNNLIVHTQLASDGIQWFMPFGLKDGINKDDYTFYVRTTERTVNATVKEMTELNSLFDSHESFKEGNDVSIVYTRLDLLSAENSGESSAINAPVMSEFWQDDFWDKFGLLVSISLAAISGLVTWYFSTRKKRNFKKVLRDANFLIESYVQDNNRAKTSLIELKDNATSMLEKGEITENQFLIVKQRLDEIETQIREQQTSKV